MGALDMIRINNKNEVCDKVCQKLRSNTRKLTKRQRSLAAKNKKAEKQQQYKNNKIEERKSTKQIKLEKQRILNENIMNFCMKHYPANFLLESFPKYPVCHCCLESGSVMKCIGKCRQYFHKRCLNKSFSVSDYKTILEKKMFKNEKESNVPASTIEQNLEDLQCTICTTSTINVCFVCSNAGDDCIQCCDKNCGKAYHLECLKYWPQHKKQYTSDKIKSILCSRHVCHTCVSPDIRKMFNSMESDKNLIKCMLCPATYHRLSECIPAGSELLSESQLICARHQSTKNGKRINTDYCVLCSKGGSLICCDTCAYAFHRDCLKLPVGDTFICEVIPTNIKST